MAFLKLSDMLLLNIHSITRNVCYMRMTTIVLLFLSLTEVSVEFNISFSYADSNFSNRHFLHEQFLISKYSSILHELLHSQWHMLKFNI